MENNTMSNESKAKAANRALDLLDDEETSKEVVDTNIKAEVLPSVIAEKVLKDKDVIDTTPISEKVGLLYKQCLDKAKIKDPDGIIATYIDDCYNPDTSKLDLGNLYLNLLVLSRLQELDIINFYFDERNKKYSTADYYLELDWYKKFMSQPVEDIAKYVHILEKNFKLSFYKAMFDAIVSKADRMSYSKTNAKMKSVWKFLDEEDDDRVVVEDYLIEFIEKKTIVGSVIMVTPDLVPFFKFDETNIEEYAEKPYVKYVGKWKDRFVHEIDTEQITNLKGFKRGAFFIKEGNTFNINPERPLVYFNTIENPFLEKPVLKFFTAFDFNFLTSATTFLKVEDM